MSAACHRRHGDVRQILGMDAVGPAPPRRVRVVTHNRQTLAQARDRQASRPIDAGDTQDAESRAGAGRELRQRLFGVQTPAAAIGAMPLLDRFGQGLPVAACRSYHRHFRAVSGVALSRPVTDVDAGFTLTPMERGLRLVGGAELLSPARATGDLAPRASALNRATTLARKLLPLGAAVEEAPVAGLRAFVPDLLPIVGPVPGRPGLWLSIGHERDGFALAPAMGRLLADLMTGSLPLADPLPYAPARFLQV